MSSAQSGRGEKTAQPPLLVIGTDGGDPFFVDANVVATGRTCVIGASGSGKSYAVGVICEELCKNGVPFALVDTEGEYSSLKEKYEVVWVADDDRADLKWGSFSRKELAAQAPEVPPLILDVSESEDRNQIIGAFLSDLYREVEERRVPYLVIVEEADKFVPQVGNRLPIFDEIARRGRKRGIGLMVCTQRPSVVDKNVLSQCGNQLVGKLVIRNDLQAVSQFFPGHTLPKQLTGLRLGDFYAMGGLSPAPTMVRIRARETRPGGVTPQFKPRKIRPLHMSQVVPLAGTMSSVTETETEPPRAPTRQKEVPDEQPGETKKAFGIPFAMPPDQVPVRVKRLRSFGVFGGQQEVIGDIQQVHRRLLELGIGLKAGVLGRRHETKYTVLDALTGKRAVFGRKLVLEEGLERLVGLEARDVEVLRVLSGDQYQSAIDIGHRVRVTPDMARRLLRMLEQRRLAKSSQMGRVTVYRRTVGMPDFDLKESPLDLAEIDYGQSANKQDGIREDQLRETIKGLRADYDLVSLRPFLYPLYRVRLALGAKSRTVWMDGVSGEETQF